MSILFLDTSHNLTLGLLDEKFQWEDYQVHEGGKTATSLHEKLHQLLNSHSLKLRGLKGAIQIAGPGSYTGMRVSDGLFQSLKLFGIETFSFYHFEVPSLLGIKEGLWISNAFKGEIFTYSWKDSCKQEKLWSEKDFISAHSSETQLFTHHFKAFSPTFSSQIQTRTIQETSALIREHSEKLFFKLYHEKSFKPLFYYRPIDQEFKKPN